MYSSLVNAKKTVKLFFKKPQKRPDKSTTSYIMLYFENDIGSL